MPRPRSNPSKKLRKVIKRKVQVQERGSKFLGQSGKWLVVVGFALVLFPFAFKNRIRYSPAKVNTSTSQTAASPLAQIQSPITIDKKLLAITEPSQPPMRVVVPGLSVDLPIVEAPVVNGYWETSETSASHGIGSANPGDKGNIVVFAHARDELFGPLRKIKKGDQVYLLTKDHWYKYQISETKEVNPADTQVIAPTAAETLTLYTCTGFLDGKRLIISATPLKS